MLFPPDFAWPRYVSWARALLAAAALTITYFLPGPVSALMYGVLGVFLAYSTGVAIRSRWQSGTFGLLVLFADTIFFLIVASFGAENLLWVASVFYLYLLTEALVFYSQVEVLVVAAVCAIFCAVLPYAEIHMLERTVVVAGVLAVAFAASKQRQKARVEELQEQLQEAQKTAEKAREQERVRIASDFHDGPLQSFISLQMRLEILRKLMERDLNAGMQDLKQLYSLAQSQVRDLRAFLHSMRPVDVDGANLVSSARRTAESFQKESGLPVTFLGANTPVGLPQEMSGEVLQMLREALHNVQKHAGATRVAVSMEKTDRGLEISVDDNGHGFNFAGTYTLEELELLRLGPASLKRRARSLNADLLLESRPGRGAGLKFRIPLQ
ncbi:MAG: sensor histidine kinase [Acidobacteriia bacterium]|nr:sensor histidine kinase [Terriglobia bacterium]